VHLDAFEEDEGALEGGVVGRNAGVRRYCCAGRMESTLSGAATLASAERQMAVL
jgi:hypothetical protein